MSGVDRDRCERRAPWRARWVAVVVACAVAASCSGSSDGASPSTSNDSSTSTSSTAAPDDATSVGTDSAPSDEGTMPAFGSVAAPVAIDSPTDFGNGVEIRISDLQVTNVDVDPEAALPGEISGPGVVATVEITNGSAEPIDLDLVIVDLVGSDGASATQVLDRDRPPFSGRLGPSASQTASYVFTVAPDRRAGASVLVRYSSDVPAVVFEGDLPNA